MSKLANHYRNVAGDYLYLAAEDLPEKGAKVTIEKYGNEEITSERGKETKFVLHFKGKSKGMVCNKTNRKLIAAALGTPYCDEWIGKEITIYPTQVKAFGKMQMAIRVKA